MQITLRDALPDDEPFLLQVYACTRAQEMALVPWDEEQKNQFLNMQFAAQHSHYRAQSPQPSFSIIYRDDLPVGRLYVLREEQDIRILDITILPEYRNCGTGSSLVQDLIAEAAATRKRIRIYVETYNPSLQLFERLGFKNVAEEGMNFLLEWAPDSKSA